MPLQCSGDPKLNLHLATSFFASFRSHVSFQLRGFRGPIDGVGQFFCNGIYPRERERERVREREKERDRERERKREREQEIERERDRERKR